MLTIKGLVASYGHIEVLHGIDIRSATMRSWR